MQNDNRLTKGDEKKRLHEARKYWDNQATSFDNEPDHGLNDRDVQAAWTELLRVWLPLTRAKILDIGCGTGSLSVLLAGLDHQVTGIDLSPAMISHAEEKAVRAGLEITFQVMEASYPSFSGRRFDGLLCRHVLWSLPDIAGVLRHWVGLLEPGGRMLLIEGYWHTGGGLHSEEVVAALPSTLTNTFVQDLSAQPNYWGKEVNDERYAITTELKK